MTMQKHPLTFGVFKATVLAAVVSGMVLLSGCSTMNDILKGDKIDYKSAGKAGPSLDVPPDLTQLTRETRYVVPGTAVSANAFQVGQGTQALPLARLACPGLPEKH